MDLGTIASGALALFTGGGSTAVSAIGGGIIGGIASIFRLRHDYKMRALDYEDKKDQRKHNENILMREIAGAENLQKLKFEETVIKKDFDGLIESIKASTKTLSEKFASKMSPGVANFVGAMLGIADFLTGLVRPGVAVYSVYFIFYKVWAMIPPETWVLLINDKEIAQMIAMSTLNTATFIASTAVSWFFGSRPSRAPREVKSKSFETIGM
jgi:hypothetical protein